MQNLINASLYISPEDLQPLQPGIFGKCTVYKFIHLQSETSAEYQA